jgi:hypothetical protein
MITQTFEPLRPIYAEHDVYAPFWWRTVHGFDRVYYGASEWPSMSYWIVPGTIRQHHN